MDSDLFHNQLQQPQQQSMNSGLQRYRSAPSSYFSSLMSSGIYAEPDVDSFFNTRVHTDQLQARFSSSGCGDQIMNQVGGFDTHFLDSVKQEQETASYSEPQPVVYQSQNQFQSHMNHGGNQAVSTSSGMDHRNFGNQNLSTSSGMDGSMSLRSNSLLRQTSSPAGFFDQLDMDNGYPVMRSMDDFRNGRRSNVGNSMLLSMKRMKNEMEFTSGSLTSGALPLIPENEVKTMEMKSGRYDGGFGSHSWDDADNLSDSFFKEQGESDQAKLASLNSSENQNGVGRIRAPTTLVSHVSLPSSTAELDKLLQFQDTVSLRSRAKRGCATHPRSIAERVRRTRISERMRKLQELVPNMDKQTNTADMLDLAVDYIKELQKEAESLSDHQAKCTCPHKQKL